MQISLQHIHIKSRDPHATAAWWIDMFGGTRLPEFQFKTMEFVPVKFDGVQISFSTPAPGEDDTIGDPPPVPYLGLEHIGIETDDLDALLGRFAEQGLKVNERRQGPVGFEIAFVETPDGVTLELMCQTG